MSAAGNKNVIDDHGAKPTPSGYVRPELALADRRMVTAFFCDIVESSKLVIPQDPEDAYDRLSGLIDIMRRHVKAFGGTICQTLGDGVFAIFGAPVAQENHAVRACYAADAIIREVARGGSAVRIGIGSGEVLWHHAADGRQANNLATGPAVHIAAKMQQSAPRNGVRLADDTTRLASDWVDTRPAQLLILGEDEPTQSHDLLGLRSRRRQIIDDLPMVGRQTVLSQLAFALDCLEKRNGRPAFSAHLVQGAAGMGKTRLTRALVDIARSRGLRVIEWHLPAVEAVGATGPLHNLVVELLDGPLSRTKAGIAAMVRGAGAAPEEADALADLLSPCTDDHLRGGGTTVLTLAIRAITALVQTAATRHPLLLSVEDAQWADTGVQAVLSALFGLPAATPMVITLSCREEGLGKGIAIPASLRHHPLGPLSSQEVGHLLDNWMGPSPALASIKADLTRRALGNPFFLVECIRVLVMRGRLLGDVGAMLPGPAPQSPLPDTVQALMTARVDMLDEEARHLLRAAAVVGTTFDTGLLTALVGEELVERRLPDLVNLGLVEETRLLPRRECSFHHALLHEAVYAGIMRRSRQHLHAQVSTLLGTADFANLTNRLAVQARHAAAGCQWAVAVEAGRGAAREALGRSLAVEAVALLSVAIDANEHLGDTREGALAGIDLRLALARAAMPAGDGSRAMLALDRAVMLARAVGDESRALAGLVQQINYERVYGSMAQALALTETALSYSDGIAHAHPELLITAAACYLDNGEAERAMTLLDLAERPAAWDGHSPGRYLTLNTTMLLASKRASCLSLLGRDAEAEIFVNKAVNEAENSNYPFNGIYVRLDIAEIRMRQRRYGDVLAYSSSALNSSRNTGSTLLDAIHLARRGLALAYLGRVAGGLADVERGLRLAQSRGAALHVAWASHARVLALALAGRLDDALKERQDLARTVQERGYGLLRQFVPDEGDIRAMTSHLPANSPGLAVWSAPIHG